MKKNLNYSVSRIAGRTLFMVLMLLLVFSSQLTADDLTKGQSLESTKITLSFQKAPLQAFIRKVESQTPFRFTFDEQETLQKGRITIKVRNESLAKVLEQVASNNLLAFKQVNNYIHVRALSPDKPEANLLRRLPAAAEMSVAGRVTAKTGEGLPGVTVLLKGTTNGTTTNPDGSYSMTVPNGGGILIFSFIGFTSREVSIPASGGTLHVTLTEDAKALEEIVVVGYGTQKKVSMTGAVSEVKGEDLLKRTTSNVQQALQGQVAGMTILDQGAGPGKSNMVMRVRGITTLSGTSGANEPLVMVDGIEQRLADINPNDIESISVLKDASSTAIYGSRAANGVILVTTKRAKAGKVTVTYNGYYARQKTNNNPVHMELEDYMRLQNVAWNNSSGAPIYTEDYIREYVNATDRLKYPMPNTWYETVLHTAPQAEQALSVSGGNETIRARLSLRYRDQDGIIANSGSKISEVRLNTDYTISPKINIGTDVNYRSTNNLSPINEGVVFERMLQTSQWTVPKFPDGTYGISSDGHNPLMYAEIAGTAKTQDDYLFGNIKGDWEIIRNLKFTTQLGARFTLTTGKNFSNSYEIRDYYNPDIVKKNVPINNLSEIRNDVREFTINNLLNYSATLGYHSFNVLAGYSQIENRGSSLNAFRQNFYNNEIQSLSQGANDATKNNGGNEYAWGLRSYFSRLNYSYRDRYLFEVNGRYDGSSRFLDANRYSFFPSFSAGWRLSEEKFWSGMGLDKAVNELKLRGSLGKTGNQAVDLYSYFSTLNLLTYSFNGVPVQGFAQERLANQNLTWETTTQSNVGLDAQLLNNRFSFSIDYFNKQTDDILLVLPVPGTLGLQAAPQNAGRMDNRGWEFLLGSRNQFGEVGFNANMNFNVNYNEVKSLAGTGPYITGGNETRFITGEGYAINSFWGYRTDGLFQTEEEILNYPTLRSGLKPGDVKFVDQNQDGKITADDMGYLGQSFPKYTFGSNLNFTYKGFSLDMLFQGVAGAKTRIGGAIIEMGIWGGFTHELIAGNYWTPENPGARFPRPLKYDLRNFVMSDRDLMNGAYLRLKNIQLAYQIPAFLTQKIGIQRMNLYVSGTNLLTFAKLNEWNVDPETVPGGRTQVYPQTSLSTVGINITL